VRCEGQAAADATWVELEALMPLGSNSKHSRTFQLKDTLVVKGGRDVMTEGATGSSQARPLAPNQA
jgi:hypothetical protein